MYKRQGMRSKSPELMSEIKKYIEDYYLQNRQSPSTTKIAEAVGIDVYKRQAYRFAFSRLSCSFFSISSIRSS